MTQKADMLEAKRIISKAWKDYSLYKKTGNGKFPNTDRFRNSFDVWYRKYVPEIVLKPGEIHIPGPYFGQAIEQNLLDGLHITDAQLMAADDWVEKGSPVRDEIGRRLAQRGQGRHPRTWHDELARSRLLNAVVVTWDYLKACKDPTARDHAFSIVATLTYKSKDTLKNWWSDRPYKNM